MKNQVEMREFLLRISDLDIDDIFSELKTSEKGLTTAEALVRLKFYGKNHVAREKALSWYWMLLNNFKNPFILVLITVGTVSYLMGDLSATTLVSVMVMLSVGMRFLQEFRSSRAAEVLRAMVLTKATVKRDHQSSADSLTELIKEKSELPFEKLVPGDIIYLSAGDMVPADVRLIHSKDLFISQSALTGESMPVEKYDTLANVVDKSVRLSIQQGSDPIQRNNLCFMGTSIISGAAEAVVVVTGSRTYFGSLAKHIIGYRATTSFDKGVNSVTWLLIRFIVVMVPIIFVMNGLVKGSWQESFLFALAVALGLTPEMLPMIITANLAKGAVAMSRHKVIVKRLNSIQNLGAMDILCTDKTGTLTQDKIILEKYLDLNGSESRQVLEYGFLNSFYQSGLKNMLDQAVLNHVYLESHLNLDTDYEKVDEIPFDFQRRRMSVVVIYKGNNQHLFICKGAVEEILNACTHVQYNDQIVLLDSEFKKCSAKIAYDLNEDGFRVIAVAYKKLSPLDRPYHVADECGLILVGVMAFLDPPKETTVDAIHALYANGVTVKILTGDNEIITRSVCKQVNLPFEFILLGDTIEKMSDEELGESAESTTIFARLTPLQKARIIKVLQKKGHTVGFLGDGINDAVALRDSDVGISVDSATDIARESADIILLEKSLLVLSKGVLKGREVYGNIIKYIKMTASSNFANVFSILIASAFLPFLPMLPLQLLVQNFCYDIAQLALPWDSMDKEFLQKPRKWEPGTIARFMVFIGPISSIFDVITFLLMWHVFHANSIATQNLFQTGWFVEGLLSQTLVVHMIRTRKIPFFQSVAAKPLLFMTAVTVAVGLYFPRSFLAPYMKLVYLPDAYYIWLAATLFAYCVLAQFVKMWYIKKFNSWL